MSTNRIERIKMVKAMEFIARNLNDEEIFDAWLSVGVADGDIEYGDLSVRLEDIEENFGVRYYTSDENLSALMGLFLRMMARARKSGGLYCDGVVGKD